MFVLACTAALLAAPLPPAEATLAAASTHAQLAHPATIRDQLMQFADASGAAYLALSRELVNHATEVLPELRSLLAESLQTEQPTGDQLRASSRWLSLLLQVDDGNSFGLAQQALAKSWREQGEDATACMSDGDAQSKWCELLDRSATHRVDSWLALASDATLSEVARSHALDRVIAGASIEWIVQFSTSLQGGSPELLRASIAAISRRALREPDVATSLRAALELPAASIYQSYLRWALRSDDNDLWLANTAQRLLVSDQSSPTDLAQARWLLASAKWSGREAFADRILARHAAVKTDRDEQWLLAAWPHASLASRTALAAVVLQHHRDRPRLYTLGLRDGESSTIVPWLAQALVDPWYNVQDAALHRVPDACNAKNLERATQLADRGSRPNTNPTQLAHDESVALSALYAIASCPSTQGQETLIAVLMETHYFPEKRALAAVLLATQEASLMSSKALAALDRHGSLGLALVEKPTAKLMDYICTTRSSASKASDTKNQLLMQAVEQLRMQCPVKQAP